MDLLKLLTIRENKILRKRFWETLLSSLLFVPVLLSLLSISSSFHLLHLSFWMSYNFHLVLSMKFWGYVLLVGAVMGVLVTVNAAHFNVAASIHVRRLDALFNIFTPMHLCLFLMHTVIFTITTFFAHSVVNDFHAGVSSTVRTPTYNCLVLSVSMSVVMAALVLLKTTWCCHYVYSFPEINLTKAYRIKEGLRKCFGEVVRGLWRVFVCVHVLLALVAVPLVHSFINNYFGFMFFNQGVTLFSFFSTEHVHTHVCVLVCLQLLSCVPLLLHNVYFSQACDLEVCKRFEGSGELSLCEALNCHHAPLLKHLACIRLNNIAKFDVTARSELFSLSKPGKRPVYWSSVVKNVLQALNSLTSSIYLSTQPRALISFTAAAASAGGAASSAGGTVISSGGGAVTFSGGGASGSGGVDESKGEGWVRNTSGVLFNQSFKASPSNNCSFLNIPSQSYNNNNNSSGANIDSNNNNVNNNLNLLHDSAINASFASHNSTFQNYNKLHSSEQSFTRNDNLNNCSTNNNISSLHSTQAPSPLRDATTRFKYQATRSLFNSHHFALNKTTNTFATTPPSLPFSRKLLVWLWSTRVVSYWLTERLEMKNRLLFQYARLHAWMVKSVSLLVAHSFTEDQYGVVQRDLADILVCLLATYEVLNKPVQLSAPKSKGIGVVGAEGRLKNELKCQLKHALYRISITFEDHLLSLNLPSEQVSKLQQFRNFKE